MPECTCPKGWTRSSMGAVARFLNGFPFKPEDWRETGTPIIRIAQMTDPLERLDRYVGTVPPDNRIDNGDLLFSWSATLMTLVWGRGPAFLNQHIFKVVPNGANSLAFVHHLLNHEMDGLAANSHGTTMRHIKRKDLLPYPILVPTIQEQRRIAEILDTVDEAIRRTEQVIEKLQQMKQGLLHDLLTRGIDDNGELRPSPGEAPHLYKDSPLGLIPREWTVRSVGALVKESGGLIQTGPFGSQLHANEYIPSGVPVVMPQDIVGEGFDETHIAQISQNKASDLRRHRLFENDVVFSRRGDLSRCAEVTHRQRGWLCGTGCLLVRFPQRSLISWWLTACYRHDIGQRQVLRIAVGTTMVNLNTAILNTLLIPLPGYDEQKRASNLVNTIQSQINAEANLLKKHFTQKKGLMDDLLTGKVRVGVPEGEC